jgi:hypothetical protein
LLLLYTRVLQVLVWVYRPRHALLEVRVAIASPQKGMLAEFKDKPVLALQVDDARCSWGFGGRRCFDREQRGCYNVEERLEVYAYACFLMICVSRNERENERTREREGPFSY